MDFVLNEHSLGCMGTVSNSVFQTEVDINQSKWYVQSMIALYSSNMEVASFPGLFRLQF